MLSFCKEGHIPWERGISRRGTCVATDPARTAAVEHWPVPTNVTEVRSSLALCSKHGRFIKDIFSIAKCLYTLTEKGTGFKWTSDCQSAFDTLKCRLNKAPTLVHPDFNHSFISDTDASNVSIGTVLSQIIDGTENNLAYASWTLTKCEHRYCATRKELLAVVHFVKNFWHYLCEKELSCELITAHWNDFSSSKILRQLTRWFEILSAYKLQIQHRQGAQHKNEDALSRTPCRQCAFQSDWDKDGNIHQSEIRTINENKVKTKDKDIPSSSLREKQDKDINVSLIKKTE